MKKILLLTFVLGILTGYILFTISHKNGGAQVIHAQDSDRYDRTVRVVQKSINSVVNISTKQTVQRNPFYQSDPFFDFWQFFYPRDPGYEAKSLGSGVIIEKEGYILTNEHIILSAKSK